MSDRFIIPKGGVPDYPHKMDGNSVYFRHCKNSCEYIRKTYDNVLAELQVNSHLYEMIWKQCSRRFHIDLDGIKTNNGLVKELVITYDDIVILAKQLTAFLRLKYHYDNEIEYRIQPSFNKSEPIPDTFRSVHIVFDVACQTHFEMNQAIRDFVNMKYLAAILIVEYFYFPISRR